VDDNVLISCQLGSGGRIMHISQHPCDLGEGRVRIFGSGLDRLSFDIREDLPSLSIDSKKSRRPTTATSFQQLQHLVPKGCPFPDGTPDSIANTDNARSHLPTGQRNLDLVQPGLQTFVVFATDPASGSRGD
jgi:hypothetical protein